MKVSLPVSLVFALAVFAAQISPAADNFSRLSAAKIRAKFIGMEMTDNVHWRDGYRRDGVFWSSSMGLARTGKWRIEDDQLCIELTTAADSGCYEVWGSGDSIELRPTGPGLAIHGVIEKPADRN
jgi:hypothetical protein